MNKNLSIELALKRNKYSFIYNFSFLIIFINIVFIYLINTFYYFDYSYFIAKFVNNNLELEVNLNDIDYFKNNNTIIIDGICYNYSFNSLNNYNFYNKNNRNTQCIYLNIENFSGIENCVYHVKILKGRMTLAKYLIRFIGGSK